MENEITITMLLSAMCVLVIIILLSTISDNIKDKNRFDNYR